MVNRYATTLTLTSSMNPSSFGEGVTFEATVSSTGTPTGALAILVNGTEVKTGSGSSLSFSTDALAVGSYTVTATYAGDDATEASEADPLSQEVQTAPTSTTLNVKPNKALPGQPVRLTTRVTTRGPVTGTPTGAVTLLSGQTVLGNAPLIDGAAEFELFALPIGSHDLRARYGGDAGFAASNSPKRTVTVDARLGNTIPVDRDGAPGQDGDKNYPAVAELGGGGFVVVWQTSVDDDNRIYARQYKPTGEPAGDEFRVGATTGTGQGRPAIARVNASEYVVVWEAQERGGKAIYGQRYRGENTRGEAFLIGDAPPEPTRGPASGGASGGVASADAPADDLEAGSGPAIAALGDGGFVVAWAADLGDGKGRNVYARRYGADRQPAGDAFRVNPEAESHQWQPSVAALAGGGFVVTWSSNENDEAIIGVYGQRYDAAARKVGKRFRVMAPSQFRSEPAVTGLADSEFVVAYSARQGELANVQNIHARRYDQVGALDAAFAVNTARNRYQFAPRVAAFADGRFIVAWSYEDGGASEIQARLYNAQGQPLSGAFRVDPATTGVANTQPALTVLANGIVVAVWRSHDTATQASRIQAQRLNLKGIPGVP